MCSGDHNAPQLMASADQNVPQHQKATCAVATWVIEAIELTKTPSPILSDDKYLIIKEARLLAIDAHNHQWALACAPEGTPLVCRLPSGPSIKIDSQTREAASLEFCLTLLNQIYDIDKNPK